MPGLDATGPQGQGPMTGWGQGRCQSDDTQLPPVFAGRGRGGYRVRGGFQGRFFGRGRRRGSGGRGRGLRWGGPYAGRRQTAAAPPIDTAPQDLEFLKREADAYALHLERIKARIAELETSEEASLDASPVTSSTSTEST
jgi:hypothetical protein